MRGVVKARARSGEGAGMAKQVGEEAEVCGLGPHGSWSHPTRPCASSSLAKGRHVRNVLDNLLHTAKAWRGELDH